MALYREVDGFVYRQYELGGEIQWLQTDKGLLEIVPTKEFGDALFLDGELQMTKKDEYIYHEMLVHPAMSCHQNQSPLHVCILGGGDGCAAREVLRWPTVQSIDIYDWDKDLITLFQTNYASWNHHSLQNPAATIHLQNVLELDITKKYNVVFIDLLDPKYREQESKTLWSTLLPRLPNLLTTNGSITINAGGFLPWDTTNIEWLQMLLANAFTNNTTHTLQAYKVFVPSFAREWCFLFINPIDFLPLPLPQAHNFPTRYFDTNTWLLASTWTKEYSGILTTEPTKLNGYLPRL